MPDLPTRKRIMRKFRIDEISSVDRPAQEGARAVIMKRAPDDDHDDHDDETRQGLAAEGRRLRASGGVDIDEIDRQLLDMARVARKPDETAEQSFSRLADARTSPNTEFVELLHERMRA